MVNDKLITIEMQRQIGLEDPQGVIADAIRAAKVLVEVISQKKHPVIINEEQYLEFEDWQVLGQFYHVAVSTGDAVPVEVDGVKGAKAIAKLINTRTGEIIGGAEGYCMRDEPKWSSRPKYEFQVDGSKVKIGDEPVPWFQLASMAQTRAGAKAHRNRLAWIASLAGYKTTPAEEMTGSETMKENVDSKYYCKEHKTIWFKRGKMTSYAHPIEGSKDWCHMPSEKPELPKLHEHEREIETPIGAGIKATPAPVAVKTENTPQEPPEAMPEGNQGRIKQIDRLPTLHPDYIAAVHTALDSLGVKPANHDKIISQKFPGANTVAQLTMAEAEKVIATGGLRFDGQK